MPLGSLHHPFSDLVADIDGLSVRTRLAVTTSGSHPSTTSSTAAQSSDEKLPLRGFDVDQSGSSSSRTRSQRQRLDSWRQPAAELSQSATIIDTPRDSSHSGPTALHSATQLPAPPRPLCVIDCCCCCAGSILISWLKVYTTLLLLLSILLLCIIPLFILIFG